LQHREEAMPHRTADAARRAPLLSESLSRSRNLLRCLTALALLALLAAPAAAEPAKDEPLPKLDHYTSGIKTITVERFEPAVPGKHPAIVFLHALDGLDDPYAGYYRRSAAEYAAKGYVVVLPHYFDRTSPQEEDRKAIRAILLDYAKNPTPTAKERLTVVASVEAWSAAVGDAVAYVRALPNVDGERVGLVGFSLGGLLALSVAAQEDLKIAAVVDFFGGLPEEQRARVKKLPPALVLHGDKDDIVPVKEAEALRELFDANCLEGEVKVYSGVGHMFLDEKGNVTLTALMAMADAKARTTAHLEKCLKGTNAAGAEAKPRASAERLPPGDPDR
jgi:carboxymethylenebutenolidase